MKPAEKILDLVNVRLAEAHRAGADDQCRLLRSLRDDFRAEFERAPTNSARLVLTVEPTLRGLAWVLFCNHLPHDFGEVLEWHEIGAVHARFPLASVEVDCGFRTEEVRQICAAHGWAPIKRMRVSAALRLNACESGAPRPLDERLIEARTRFRYADENSRAAALDALALGGAGNRGAFLIQGPPLSGKTRLARLIFGADVRPFGIREDGELARFLPMALEAGVLFLDDLPRVEPARGYRHRADGSSLWPTLEHFTTASEWSWRVFRTMEIRTAKNRCLVVVTTSAAELAPDLARRFRVIRLEGFER